MADFHLTNYAERKVLDHISGFAAWPSASRYLGWCPGYPAADEDRENGTGLVEPSGGGYARINLNSWAALTYNNVGSPGSGNCWTWTKPTGAFTFTDSATQTVDWGMYASGSGGAYDTGLIWDAATGGNLLAWFPCFKTGSATGGVGYKLRWGFDSLRFHLDREMSIASEAITEGCLSLTYRQAVLRHILGIATLAQPAWWFNPWLVAGAGATPCYNAASELGGTTRVQGMWNQAITDGLLSVPYRGTHADLSADMVFPAPDYNPLFPNGAPNWGAVVATAWDASSGGNLIGVFNGHSGSGTMTVPHGHTLYIRAGSLFLKAW